MSKKQVPGGGSFADDLAALDAPSTEDSFAADLDALLAEPQPITPARSTISTTPGHGANTIDLPADLSPLEQDVALSTLGRFRGQPPTFTPPKVSPPVEPTEPAPVPVQPSIGGAIPGTAQSTQPRMTAMPPLENPYATREAPIVGIARGVGKVFANPRVQSGGAHVLQDDGAARNEQVKSGVSDVLENLGRATEAPAIIGAIFSPVSTTVGIAAAKAAGAAAQKGVEMAGGSPEDQRLAANIAAAAVTTVTVNKTREFLAEQGANARAARAARGPEPPPQEPISVGRSATPGARPRVGVEHPQPGLPPAAPPAVRPQSPAPPTPPPVVPPAPPAAPPVPIERVLDDLAAANPSTPEGFAASQTALAELERRGISAEQAAQMVEQRKPPVAAVPAEPPAPEPGSFAADVADVSQPAPAPVTTEAPAPGSFAADVADLPAPAPTPVAPDVRASAQQRFETLQPTKDTARRVPFPTITVDEGSRIMRASDQTAGQVREIPLAQLVSTQPDVANEHVARYLDDPTAGGSMPYVSEHGGKFILLDGAHRATAAWARGDETITAVVFPVDTAKLEKPPVHTTWLDAAAPKPDKPDVPVAAPQPAPSPAPTKARLIPVRDENGNVRWTTQPVNEADSSTTPPAVSTQEEKPEVQGGLPAAPASPSHKFDRPMYQGRGASPVDVYGQNNIDLGRDFPILGRASYYAPTEDLAQRFGAVTAHQVRMREPLVLNKDAQVQQLLHDADATILNGLADGRRYWQADASEIKAATERLQAFIRNQGFDGVVVEGVPTERSARKNSLLSFLFAHDQAIVFDRDADTSKAPAPVAPAAPSPVAIEGAAARAEFLRKRFRTLRSQIPTILADTPAARDLAKQWADVTGELASLDPDTAIGEMPAFRVKAPASTAPVPVQPKPRQFEGYDITDLQLALDNTSDEHLMGEIVQELRRRGLTDAQIMGDEPLGPKRVGAGSTPAAAGTFAADLADEDWLDAQIEQQRTRWSALQAGDNSVRAAYDATWREIAAKDFDVDVIREDVEGLLDADVEGAPDASPSLNLPGREFRRLIDENKRTAPVWQEPDAPVNVTTAKLATIAQAEADARIAAWRAEAERIGREEDHSNEVVFSLFDRTGGWSEPYRLAGYDVRTYDIANGDDLQEFFPIADIADALAEGKKIVGVLAAPPCTSFAVSGARWWADQHDKADVEMVEKKYGWRASRYFDTPLDYANTLVALTEAFIEFANPSQFYAMENPVGRIKEQNQLPKPSLAFDPANFGNPYTKKTFLWGSFNADLPTANVEPTKGSFIATLRGDDPSQKAERSTTPEGFAFAFFMANHRPAGAATPSLTKSADAPTVGASGHEAPSAPGNREPLAGTPSEDGGRPRSGEPARRSGAGGGRPDRGRRVVPDSAGDAPVGGAGDVPGAVRVPAERGRRTGPADRQTAGDAILFDFRDDLDALAASAFNERKRLEANLAAVRLLKQLETENRYPSADEQRTLAAYVGWGGLSNAFDKKKPLYSAELRELLTDDEYAAARRSVLNAHYTSAPIIRAMYRGLAQLGVTGPLRVLEPSVGVGHFFGWMDPEMSAQATRVGIELDSLSARLAQRLYPQARIIHSGFEKAALAPESFDLAIGNPPFGDYAISDPAMVKTHGRFLTAAIHNYFFAKSLELTRPGGIVAFITSRYTMDAQDRSVRQWMHERAELLGAFRFSNKAFRGNAKTDVVTDVLFLQKRMPGADIEPAAWVNTTQRTVGSTPFHVNSYYDTHPGHIFGAEGDNGSMAKSNEPQYTVNHTFTSADEFEQAVLDGMAQLPAGVFVRSTSAATRDDLEPTLPADSSLAPEHLRDNSWFLDADNRLRVKVNGIGQLVTDLTDADAKRIRAVLPVRDALRDTMATMLSVDATAAQIKAAQKRLTTAYDSFVKAHGYLSKPANYKALREDPDVFTLLALEEWKPDADEPTKAAIFTKRTLQPQKPIEQVDTPKEALLVSLNETGRVDWPRMAALTGKTVDDLQGALEGLVFLDPTLGTWEIAERYLSGNVKAKLAAAREGGERFALNVRALEGVQPADIEPSDIGVRLGAPWVPTDVLEAFAEHLGLSGLRISHSASLSKFFIDRKRFRGSYSFQNREQWGTKRRNADDLLEQILNLGDPTVHDTVRENGSERQVVNQTETVAAREKAQAIADEFKSWVWADAARATRLARLYNDRMNATRLWQPDGSHLTLPGMVDPSIISMRPHQKDFIWRGLQQPNLLAHHVVGAGKTFAAIALAMEKRRLGLARKPLIVVPNHLVQQWARDVLRLYPAARVLASEKKDFEAKNRKRFLNRIATGDWDVVVLPMSQFGRIKVQDETFNAYLRKEMDALEVELERARRDAGKDDPTVKELEKAQARLESKLRNAKEGQAKDNTLTFEELGVDMLIVDEAHNYKKLWFPTKMTRVAGVPTQGSARAFDAFIKSRWLAERNRTGGTVFLTGTPISNTMAEMFVLKRYLAQDMLDARGIPQFDGWAATFGEKVTAFEISPTGKGFRQKTRFARFSNLPELVQLYRAFADVRTADMLNLPTPALKGGKAQVRIVPGSQELDDYVESLVKRMEAIQGKKVDPSQDNPLKVTNDGRSAALDLRLVGLTQPEGGKVDTVADEVAAIYRREEKRKLTQLVFADLGTPGEGKAFSVYDALRAALVKRGVPRDQVAFIHEANTDKQKQALFDKVNAGAIRVLIGSSERMGAGMNVQQRLVALHHMDAPWRPSDIEQREGRIIRQGNLYGDKAYPTYDPNFEVEIFTYVTERSFDAYIWQLLENKARFIKQALKGDITSRETDDADDIVLNMAQIKGAASGNPAIMEHAKTQSDVQRLEMSESNHQRQRWRLQQQAFSLPEQLDAQRAILARGEALQAAIRLPDKAGDLEIDAAAITAAFEKLAGSKLTASETHYNTLHTPEVRIGKAAGVDVFGRVDVFSMGETTKRTTVLIVRAGTAQMSREFKVGDGAATSLFNFLRSEPALLISSSTDAIARLESDLALTRANLDKPFPHADKLKALRARLAELERELNVDAKGQQEAAANQGAIESDEDDDEADDDDDDDDGVSAMRLSKQPLPVRPRPAKPPRTQLPVDEIIGKLQKLLGDIPVAVGRFRQRALGIYKNKPEVVRTRVADDLQVIAHEFGHHFDLTLTLSSDTHRRGKIANELKALGEPTSLPSYTPKKRRREGAAEFFRRWLIDDHDALRADAPLYFATFDRFLADHSELHTGLEEIRVQIQGYLSLPAAEQAKLHLDFTGGSTGALKTAARIVEMARDPEQRADALVYLSSQFVDDLAYLRAAEGDMLAGGTPIDITRSAVAQARLARRYASKAEGFLRHGIRDDHGKFTGISFDEAIRPVLGRLEDFAVYAAARRAETLQQRGITTGFTARQVVEAIQELQSPEFDAALEALADFHRAKRAYFVESGMLSADQAARMDKQEPDYVPFQRVRDAVATVLQGGGRGVANRNSPVKAIKGSGLRIINPLEMIIRNTHAEVATVEANRAMLALVKLAEDAQGSGRWLEEIPPEQAATRFNMAQLTPQILAVLEDAGIEIPDNLEFDELVTVFTPEAFARPNGERIITVMDNGRRRWFQVHDEGLYDAITAIGPKGAEEVVKLFYKGARMVRTFATSALAFITRNPVRDIPVAVAQSRAGFLPHDFIKGLFAYLQHGESYQLYQHAMAEMGTMVSDDRDVLRRRLRELGHGKLRRLLDRTVLHPMEGLQALSHGLETATRLGEFMKSMRRLEARGIVGRGALMQSALNALDVTIPFGDSGRQVRAWNQYTAFFAARVGGWTRMVDAAREGGDLQGGWGGGGKGRPPVGPRGSGAGSPGGGGRGPARFMFRALSSVTLLSVLLWLLHKDDDEYYELPAWERNAYWHLPSYDLTGKRNGFIRIPKPFELGQIFGTSVEMALDWLYEKDPSILKRLPDRSSAHALLQSIVPSAVLPWVQVMSSYDFFQGRYIVQPWQEGLDPELQYSRWTSETAKRIGRELGVSPARVEALITGYTSGFGRGALNALDSLQGGAAKPSARSALPGIGTFWRPLPTSDGQSLADLYDARDAIQALKSGVKEWAAEGRPERAREEIEEIRDLLPREKAINATINLFRKQTAPQINALFANTTMTPAQKRDALDRIYFAMLQSSRVALGRPAMTRPKASDLGRAGELPVAAKK